jgi:hypothetical protein
MRLLKLASLALGVITAAATANAQTPNTPTDALVITVDTSLAPDLAPFVATAKTRCEACYPEFARYLASEGFQTPRDMQLAFEKNMSVPAGTGGTHVALSDTYFREHPADYGAVVHEMVHVIQSYPRYDPAWLVEGIADYMRFYHYEPVSARPRPNPRAKYTDGYQTVAVFLDWATRKYDVALVKQLNAALRNTTYSPHTWKSETGKDLDPLWAEFLATLQPKAEAPRGPQPRNLKDVVPDITVDVSTAPEMAEFARIAKARCEANYGRLAEYLTTDGFQPPTSFTIVFEKGKRGVADTTTQGSPVIISCAPDYFSTHDQDYGALIHEMVHVIQRYRSYDPVWLTEGIADYVRFYMYEPVSNRPHPNPDTAKYTDSYQTTACFLDWIVRSYDKAFVQKMNVLCRRGTYTPDSWKDITGKDVGTLWAGFAAWLRTQPGSGGLKK